MQYADIKCLLCAAVWRIKLFEKNSLFATLQNSFENALSVYGFAFAHMGFKGSNKIFHLAFGQPHIHGPAHMETELALRPLNGCECGYGG